METKIESFFNFKQLLPLAGKYFYEGAIKKVVNTIFSERPYFFNFKYKLWQTYQILSFEAVVVFPIGLYGLFFFWFLNYKL